MDPAGQWTHPFDYGISEYEDSQDGHEKSSGASYRSPSMAPPFVDNQELNAGLSNSSVPLADEVPNSSALGVPSTYHVGPNSAGHFGQQPQRTDYESSQRNVPMNVSGFRAPGVFYTVPLAPQQRSQASTCYDLVPTWNQTQLLGHGEIDPPTEEQPYVVSTGISNARQQMPNVLYSCTQQTQPPRQMLTIPTSELLPPVDDPDVVIGSVCRSGKLKCCYPDCFDRSFGRQAELKRHYDTSHAIHKPDFWCPVPTCRRSASAGIKSFPRKDKLMDHIESMHRDAW